MDTFNSYCVIIGIVAVCIGVYILFTRKLVGRSTGSASKETIKKFIPIEVGTYISEGLLLILLGSPERFPFVDTPAVTYGIIGLSLAIIVVNVILGKKFFPDAKPPEPKSRGPRLK